MKLLDEQEKAPRHNYMKSYYQENKEAILARKKQRYANDPEYRERIHKNKRKYQLRKKYIERQQKGHVGSVSTGGKEMKIISPCGNKSHVCKLFTVGQVAHYCSITKTQLYSWINKKRIPMSNYTTSAGWRLYTEYEMAILGKFVTRMKVRAGREYRSLRFTKEAQQEIMNDMKHLVGGVPPELYK
jgi:predicted DNA-binding transcriptional regulator AlpA